MRITGTARVPQLEIQLDAQANAPGLTQQGLRLEAFKVHKDDPRLRALEAPPGEP